MSTKIFTPRRPRRPPTSLDLVTASQAAESLGITPRWFHRLVAEGRLLLTVHAVPNRKMRYFDTREVRSLAGKVRQS